MHYPRPMDGGRKKFKCPTCGKVFAYFVKAGNEQPKVVCAFCGKDSYPNGEPPPAPAEPPKPAAAAAPAPAPVN